MRLSCPAASPVATRNELPRGVDQDRYNEPIETHRELARLLRRRLRVFPLAACSPAIPTSWEIKSREDGVAISATVVRPIYGYSPARNLICPQGDGPTVPCDQRRNE